MAARKRTRPRRSGNRGAQQQEAQRARAAERRQVEGNEMAFLSFAQVVAATGIDRTRLGAVVKRAEVPVYWSPADARKKFIRKEDVPRLTGHRPQTPPDAGADAGGGADAGPSPSA